MFIARVRIASGTVTHGPFEDDQRAAWAEVGYLRGCLVELEEAQRGPRASMSAGAIEAVARIVRG